MTKKRFVDYFDKDHNYIIQDLVNEDEYQVGFVNCDEDKFLELVNALAETSCDCITDCEIVMKKLKDENEQLKQSNLYLQNQLEDYATVESENIEFREENEQLKKELQNLQTFKKVLEYAEKDMEERADWQAYCEKEFEGL